MIHDSSRREARRPKEQRRKQTPLPLGAHRIGDETIYPHQTRLAKLVIQQLLRNDAVQSKVHARGLRLVSGHGEVCSTPVVILQPQGGKHGTSDEVIYRFILYCVENDLTFQIVVLSGLPNLTNRDQTKQRMMTEARLHSMADQTGLTLYRGEHQGQGIVLLNCSSRMRHIDFNDPDVDVRLWIWDEGHLANIKGGCITQMLANHGVYVREPTLKWGNDTGTRNHMLVLSATPYAHELQGDKIHGLRGDPLFNIIYETPSPDYTSLEIMRKNNRLRQTGDLPRRSADGSWEGTEFLERVYREFLSACDQLGPGYLVIRALGKQHDALVAYLDRRNKRRRYQVFDGPHQNLADLNSKFAEQPSAPEIIIIRGSQRAGMTLPKPNYIRSWVETSSLQVDTVAQAGAGRACGFGRGDDVYPIYCNLPKVDEAIRHYSELDQGECTGVPRGCGNKALSGLKVIYPIKEWILGPNAIQKAKQRPDWKAFEHYKDKGKGGDGGHRTRKIIYSSSTNCRNNISDLLLRGGRDTGNTFGFHMDGPTTKVSMERYIAERRTKARRGQPPAGWHRGEAEQLLTTRLRQHRASWKKFVETYPDKVGAVAVLGVPITSKEVDPDARNALQLARSALKQEPFTSEYQARTPRTSKAKPPKPKSRRTATAKRSTKPTRAKTKRKTR